MTPRVWTVQKINGHENNYLYLYNNIHYALNLARRGVSRDDPETHAKRGGSAERVRASGGRGWGRPPPGLAALGHPHRKRGDWSVLPRYVQTQRSLQRHL